MSSKPRSSNQPPDGRVAAIVLSGGQGSRFGGADKGLQNYHERPLISWVADALQPQVARILVSVNRNPAEYEALGLEVVYDEFPDYQGPMAGITAALSAMQQWPDWRQFSHLLIATCDSPALPDSYVATLRRALADSDKTVAVVFDGERRQNLHCLIDAALAPAMLNDFAQGMRAMHRWHDKHAAMEVDFSAQHAAFLNINSPQQLV